MLRHERKLWLLPWTEERNGIACAAEVVYRTFKAAMAKAPPDATRQKGSASTQAAAELIDAWQRKTPSEHDKAMLDALRALRAPNFPYISYDMQRVLGVAAFVTERALNNNLASNDAEVKELFDQIIYVPGAAAYMADAMAKWRFYDATARKNMDEEIRGAFEAYWLAGEHAAGYRFVGAVWPKEWTEQLELAWSAQDLSTSVSYSSVQLMQYGLIKRDVQ